MKLVIIDTGVSLQLMSKNNISGIGITKNGDDFWVVENYIDEIGHGTSVVDLVLQYSRSVEIFMIKLYGNDDFENVKKLQFALKYIEENIECDIIQISSGILHSNNELHQIIKKLTQKDTLIVSAFDNNGGVSYPSAYEEVLGVDLNFENRSKLEYQLIEGDIVDVRVGCGYYRAIDCTGKKVLLKGSSFATSYIVANIINHNPSKFDKRTVKKSLGLKVNKSRKEVKRSSASFSYPEFIDSVKKVVVFPFNKEIHSIARFENTLPFIDYTYYDIKHKFLLGKRISDILKDTSNCHLIEDFDSFDWYSDFDMFICGHVQELETLTGKKYQEYIYSMCKKHHKKLYCFDSVIDIMNKKDYGNRVYFPYIDFHDVPENRFGKLRKPGIPVLAIIGTSSKQGKYTTQLKLKEALEARNIRVGFLSTEPNGYLLGAKAILPFGYGSTCYVGQKLTNIANEMIWNIEKMGVEIIITGCQSGTLHYDTINEKLLMYNQLYFLTGVNPDGLILCVNDFDDIDYVKRTISYVNALTEAPVIMILISSVRKEGNKKNNKLKEYFEKNEYLYRKLEQIDNNELAQIVLDYYMVK